MCSEGCNLVKYKIKTITIRSVAPSPLSIVYEEDRSNKHRKHRFDMVTQEKDCPCSICKCIVSYQANLSLSLSTSDPITQRLAKTLYKRSLIDMDKFENTFRCPYPGYHTTLSHIRTADGNEFGGAGQQDNDVKYHDSMKLKRQDSMTRRDVCSICSRYNSCIESGLFESTSEINFDTELSQEEFPDGWDHESVFIKKLVAWGHVHEEEEEPRDPFTDLDPEISLLSRHLIVHKLSYSQDSVRPDTIFNHNLTGTIFSPSLGTQLSEFDVGLLLLISLVRPFGMPTTVSGSELHEHPLLPLVQAVSGLGNPPSSDIVADMDEITSGDHARFGPQLKASQSDWKLDISGREWCNSLLSKLTDEEVSTMESMLDSISNILNEAWPMIRGEDPPTLQREYGHSSTRPMNLATGDPIRGATWRLLELFPESIKKMLELMKKCGLLAPEDWKSQRSIIEKILAELTTRRSEHKKNLPPEIEEIFGEDWQSKFLIEPVNTVIAKPQIDQEVPWHPLIVPIEIREFADLDSCIYYSVKPLLGEQ